ncbi:hypothetical protein [Pseudokineococcus lusitanus]|nr:hypothetical protein [Pseudokineococcus lusitanus]
MMDKDLKKIVEAIEAAGYTTETLKSGHVEVRDADGRKVTTFAGTASDRRSTLNALAPLKRRGFQWPPKPPKRRRDGER